MFLQTKGIQGLKANLHKEQTSEPTCWKLFFKHARGI